MRSWRTYIVGSQLLWYELHRELQERHGVSLSDYQILVRLSEQPEQRMRMTLLAVEVAASKSRVSHQIARMEAAGLVKRMECPSDGRGVFAALTPAGMDLLREAAPTHVEGVRSHLVDLLTPDEQATLGEIFDRVRTHLRVQP